MVRQPTSGCPKWDCAHPISYEPEKIFLVLQILLIGFAVRCISSYVRNRGSAAAGAGCSAGTDRSAAGASRHADRECIGAGGAAIASRGGNRQAVLAKRRRVHPVAHTLHLPENDSNPGIPCGWTACGGICAGNSTSPGCGWEAIREGSRKTSLHAPASLSQVGGSRRSSAHPRVSTHFKPACEI